MYIYILYIHNSALNTKHKTTKWIISNHLHSSHMCKNNKKDTNKKAEKVKESGSELGPKMDRALTTGGAIKYIGKTTLELPIFHSLRRSTKSLIMWPQFTSS